MNIGEVAEITLIVPTRNQAQYLPTFLNSLKQQTFEGWRCLVINDGSTDNTHELLEYYAQEDLRFEIVTIPSFTNGNAQLARNVGITRLKTEYVLFCDSDDFFPPAALEFLFRKIRCGPELDFVYGQTEVFLRQPGDQRLVVNIQKPISDLDRVLLGDMPFMVQAILCRTRFIKDHCIVWTLEVCQLQDWDFLLSLLSCRPKYQPVHELTYFWRNDARESRVSRQVGAETLKNRLRLYYRWFTVLKSQHLLTASRIEYLLTALKSISEHVMKVDSAIQMGLRIRVRMLSFYLSMNRIFVSWMDKRNSGRNLKYSDLINASQTNQAGGQRKTLVRVSTYEWIATVLKSKH